MKQPKPILIIKQKCNMIIHVKDYDKNKNPIWYEDLSDCHKCKGTGQQETKLYSLKDFEKCDCECHSLDSIKLIGKWENHFEYVDNEFAFGKCCYKTNGYKIPKEYEPYEIKKVSKVTEEIYILYNNNKIDGLQLDRYCRVLEKHNLKEDDKIVLRKG